jgi:hypothetical protein
MYIYIAALEPTLTLQSSADQTLEKGTFPRDRT